MYIHYATFTRRVGETSDDQSINYSHVRELNKAYEANDGVFVEQTSASSIRYVVNVLFEFAGSKRTRSVVAFSRLVTSV